MYSSMDSTGGLYLVLFLLVTWTPWCLTDAAEQSSDESHEKHWGYHGDFAPSNWSEVSEHCGKKAQSPINIIPKSTVLDKALDELTLAFSNDSYTTTVKNVHHSVSLHFSSTILLSGGKLSSPYMVAGAHFHWGNDDNTGSEHTVDGKHYPLEMHVVTYNEERYNEITKAMVAPDGLAVIGLFFQLSEKDNPLLSPIIEAFKTVLIPGNETTVEGFNLKKLLPPQLTDYYRYSGSLTTPKCFESVIWTVLRQASTVSRSQLEAFRNLHQDMEGNKMLFNHRPVQPLNGRQVYSSFVLQPSLKSQEGVQPSTTTAAANSLSFVLLNVVAALFFSALC